MRRCPAWRNSFTSIRNGRAPSSAFRKFRIKKSAGTASSSPRGVSDGLHRVDGPRRKTDAADAPSNFAVIGRYVLPPEIFPILRKTQPGKNGEIQLTDALAGTGETRLRCMRMKSGATAMTPATSWDS